MSAWRERERELRLLGVDLTLISAQRWNGGGRTVRLEPGDDAFVRGTRTIGTHPSVFVFDPLPIWRALGEGPDLIDLHEEPNALATAEVLMLRWLRRCRAPYVLYSAQNIRKTYPFPFRLFERLSLRGASAAYVCNHEAGEILNAKGLAGRAVYLPLGVDLDAFAAADRPAPPEGRAVIGYIGRLEPHKGVDVLLDAIAPHPGWMLRITGDGSERKKLADRAKELGIDHRVEFLGFSDGAGLAARYRELDVLAVPSRPTPGWREQFGRVVVEGMASGVPVVASASGALPEVVGEAGILCSPGDPSDLAQGIATALEPRRWAELREAGLERAGLFAWSRIAEAQKRLYDRSMTSNGETITRSLQVLIVAFGPPDDLDGCLVALRGAFPVTVVDNSGLAETRSIAERHGARYVNAMWNRGFAAGVNLGLDMVQVDAEDVDVLLLNPDARIAPDQVQLMSARLLASSRTAAVGARQFVPGTAAPVRVWWPFPTPLGAWVEAIGLGALRRGHGFAIGSALLLRSEALKDVGRLDERFFLYAEETDWQLRARRRGWRVEVAEATATHEGGGASADPHERERHFYTSLRTFILKHHGPRGWESFRLANLFGAGLRAAVSGGQRRASALRRRALFSRNGLDT